MPLVSEQLPNLMNGVSQQAVTLRLGSQAEAQINGFSSIVDGNTKRPPTEYVAKIDDGNLDGAYLHTINRDINERYTLILDHQTARVFDLEGNEKTVTPASTFGYLATDNPKADLRAITVADYTFIVNRSRTVDKDPAVSTDEGEWRQVFIKALSYDLTFEVWVDGTLAATHTTPDTSVENAELKMATVITALKDELDLNLTGFTVTAHNSIIDVRKDDGTAFNFEVKDSGGGGSSDAIFPKMERFTDLPLVGRKDTVVEIVGEDSVASDSYFLKFVPDNEGRQFDTGYWVETRAPGIQFKLDKFSMPHVLIRKSDGTFEFKAQDWGERVVGNEQSAPWPSFIGRKINDVYFDRRRLCFLSDDNVSMSRTGDFFSFFPETVTSILDDGPIDVSTSSTSVSTLKHALPFNKRILLFSDQMQFSIDDEYLLASQPPGIDVLTEYESEDSAKPVGAGRTVFFTADRGDWASVLEYYVMADTDTTDAANVTEHVPAYIPKGIFKFTASQTSDLLLALSEGERNTVFAYKYHWKGTEKLQSSWSKWQFEDDAVIYNADFVKDVCYLLVGYPDGTYLEKLKVSEGQSDLNEDFTYRLDRRLDDTQVSALSYDSGSLTTSFVLPYKVNSNGITVATRKGDGGSALPPATAPTVTALLDSPGVGTQVVVDGDMRGVKFFVGVDYPHVYEFSEQVLKTQSQSGGRATVAAGRLQFTRWHVTYSGTGYFRAEVIPDGKKTYTYHLTGVTLGADNTVIGAIGLVDGTFQFRVNSKADRVTIRLVNDSFLPSTYTGAEWEARFVRRSSRI